MSTLFFFGENLSFYLSWLRTNAGYFNLKRRPELFLSQDEGYLLQLNALTLTPPGSGRTLARA